VRRALAVVFARIFCGVVPMRRLALVCAFTTLSTAALADAVTTRIETRPYYGAIATIEQGVRVWRALPPEDRIIIVPENAKNVSVNIDAGSSRAQAASPTVNSNVTINGSNHAGGYDGIGVPVYAHKPNYGGHRGVHAGNSYRHGGHGNYAHGNQGHRNYGQGSLGHGHHGLRNYGHGAFAARLRAH
jgi:hypothetical protein